MYHEQAADWWMSQNPGTMKLLERFALDAKKRGLRKLGISLLVERVRWYGVVEQRDHDFKVNNNHRAYIARQLMQDNPALAGFFDVRRAGGEA